MASPKKTRTNRLFSVAGPDRGVGISTGLALTLIGKAILHPNEWHDVVDHHNTAAANKALLFMIRTMVKELELKFFVIEYSSVSGKARIRCDIFGLV